MSGAASAKLPPMPTNTFTSPRCIASIVRDGVEAVLARRVDAADLGRAGRGTRSVGRWLMPQVRLPWTLLCPRIGRGPGALAADVAAQQQQVDDLADRVDAVLLLGQAQAPAMIVRSASR